MIDKFKETREKFKTEIEKSQKSHFDLQHSVSQITEVIEKAESELYSLEQDFEKSSEELKINIESKSERTKELNRLIRIEQELNIEKEKKQQKELHHNIETTRNEMTISIQNLRKE